MIEKAVKNIKDVGMELLKERAEIFERQKNFCNDFKYMLTRFLSETELNNIVIRKADNRRGRLEVIEHEWWSNTPYKIVFFPDTLQGKTGKVGREAFYYGSEEEIIKCFEKETG